MPGLSANGPVTAVPRSLTPAHEMSTPNVPPPGAPGIGAPADTTPDFDEIRVYSHSPLFYWWPAWLFGFIFALITLMDGHRMVIVPGDSLLVKDAVGNEVRYSVYTRPDSDRMENLLDKATPEARQELKRVSPALPDQGDAYRIKPHVSPRSWMGPTYLVILLLVIVITSVPLRGLWSLVVLIGLVVVALLISLFKWWDDILNAF
jgi:hypothetical protein